MAAFDSYFELLQDGSSFDLDLASNSNIVMPKLGVYIPGLSGKVSLCRTDFHTIMIRTAHKTFSIDRTNIERNFKIPVFEIQGYDELRLLCIRDLSLFEDEYINSINPDVDRENLRSMIAQSLDFISAVNYDLGTRINSLEKWFVPIFTPGPQTHTSFTIQNLSGVLFLSQATDFLRLAEAIVHEFHHAELNLLMVLEKLFDDDNDKRYYSPWRDDPRPLQGLFHGIYVFSELIDFYERAETLSNMQRYLNQIRYRKSELVHRVRIALEQIPYSSLTSTGMKIVESIRSKLDHYDTNAEPLPNHLKNHLVLWKNTNPQLVLKVPKKYHNDISSHV
jgi:HEXXH motif-containing protein